MKPSIQFSFFLLFTLALHASAADPGSATPKVVLVGDSIRLSYEAKVRQRLGDTAVVSSPKANGGDSGNVLRHLEMWVIRERPDVVHFNCGIHDTKHFTKTGRFQVSPEQYEANLREIVTRIRAETRAVVLFATSTPILNDRAAGRRQGRDYVLTGEAIQQYNAIARSVMKELGVPVNDLHAALTEKPDTNRSAEKLIGADGVHLTPEARELLGEIVADFIRPRLKADR